MKRLFVRARQKALDEINEHLADFRNKRTLGKNEETFDLVSFSARNAESLVTREVLRCLGLGNVFGESMLQGLVYGDSVREKKIVDALLLQHFETFFSGVSDFDSLPDRIQVGKRHEAFFSILV